MAQQPAAAIRVAEVARSIGFYTHGLGFKLIEHRPDADVAHIAADYGVLLAGPNAQDLIPYLAATHQVIQPGGALQFSTTDPEALHATLEARGLRNLQWQEKRWGERWLTVRDPDGYLVSFWSAPQRTLAEWLELYRQGPDELETALAGLTETDYDLAAAPGERTIRLIVHHLVDADVTSLPRMKMALAEPGRTWQASPHVPDRWAESLRYAHCPIESQVTLFRALRAHMLQLARNLPDAWERHTVDAEGHKSTFGRSISMLAMHAFEHADEIQAARRAHGR